jgi:hypothetical protein
MRTPLNKGHFWLVQRVSLFHRFHCTIKPVNSTYPWDRRKSSSIRRVVLFKGTFRDMQIWSQLLSTGLLLFPGFTVYSTCTSRKKDRVGLLHTTLPSTSNKWNFTPNVQVKQRQTNIWICVRQVCFCKKHGCKFYLMCLITSLNAGVSKHRRHTFTTHTKQTNKQTCRKTERQRQDEAWKYFFIFRVKVYTARGWV